MKKTVSEYPEIKSINIKEQLNYFETLYEQNETVTEIEQNEVDETTITVGGSDRQKKTKKRKKIKMRMANTESLLNMEEASLLIQELFFNKIVTERKIP